MSQPELRKIALGWRRFMGEEETEKLDETTFAILA